MFTRFRRCAATLFILAFGNSFLSAQSLAPASPDPALHDTFPAQTPSVPGLPSLWIIGDSTVRNGHGDGAGKQWGWGDRIGQFFDLSKINVVNRAIGGRSSRSFITEGRWADTLALMKPGDFLLVQFGHNDPGPIDDTARARGSLPGIGPEIREVENPVLKRHEIVHTFGWYMRMYIDDASTKGVTVIVCSPIPRKIWQDGHIVRSGTDTYGGWARTVAAEEHARFIDLNEIVAREYDAMGEAAVEPMFADPHTHTSDAGAVLNAKAVITGLKLLQPDPLARFFSTAAAAIPDTMPADTVSTAPVEKP